ncbi:hypothetical protein MLD38_035790 [Melastoma candidum]|uniref:Uncharacterized protein n=1 Tax=Melastoma candidum TaxID=119954 RepID=A0ACB9LH73_9MYRT|nr:hypothetical protein MLD38_035790 [Melastoma candidum]
MEMENGFFDGGVLLSTKLSRLGITDGDYPNPKPNPNRGLTQGAVAVEAAEATIKHENDENIRLRTELQDKIRELERYFRISFLALPGMQ